MHFLNQNFSAISLPIFVHKTCLHNHKLVWQIERTLPNRNYYPAFEIITSWLRVCSRTAWEVCFICPPKCIRIGPLNMQVPLRILVLWAHNTWHWTVFKYAYDNSSWSNVVLCNAHVNMVCATVQYVILACFSSK